MMNLKVWLTVKMRPWYIQICSENIFPLKRVMPGCKREKLLTVVLQFLQNGLLASHFKEAISAASCKQFHPWVVEH